jgi:hypothetical protein
MTDRGEAASAVVVDIVPDELALARAQMASGLLALAEGTLRRRIGVLEADGPRRAADELDAARTLLAEALWRQDRPVAARAALDAVRIDSPQRRRPIWMLIEAEALAAAGEPDRAAGLVERIVSAIGVDEAWRLRGGVPSRLAWPLPAELRPEPRRAQHPPWSPGPRGQDERAASGDLEPTAGERLSSAQERLEAARDAYRARDLQRGDRELAIAVRLDPSLAGDGLAILEPALGRRPSAERLLLYGDLLRGVGRGAEAAAAYDRALARRS